MNQEAKRPLVLIVEDNFVMADIVQRALHHGGFEVNVRHNGWEALEACNQFDYDAVITDYQMPGINGLQFVEALRKAPRNHAAPVFFVSGKGLELDSEHMRAEYGVRKVLHKPFSPHELIGHLRKCIDEQAAIGPLVVARSEPAAACTSLPTN